MLDCDALIRNGYLPEVVPPLFSTKSLADFVLSRKKIEFISRQGPKARTKLVEYDATKRANQRRTFAMPHPDLFHDISLFVAQNWQTIQDHYKKSKYSLSIPEVGRDPDRSIGITSHRVLAVQIYKVMSPYRYIVRSDISRFYPSIYTHTIPWSIHGKERAKDDPKPNSKTIIFNKLDSLLRQAQDGQSIGIPIGPDTSRIIAEMVAVQVDKNFSEKYHDDIPLIRHVDDIWIGADSMDQAEDYLYTYRECLRDFELDINDLKTSITENTRSLDPSWPLSLKMLIKNEFKQLNEEDKTRALWEIFRFAKDERDDGIIKYAIRRFDKEKMWRANWNVLEEFLIRSLVVYPHSIDYVARVVARMHLVEKNIEIAKWHRVLLHALERNAKLGNDSEVCWIIWLMKELTISVPRDLGEHILLRCGVFPVVMLIHLDRHFITRSRRRKSILKDRLGDDPFSSSQWLLAYETSLHGWLTDKDLDVSGLSQFMKDMMTSKVGFFDLTARPWFVHRTEEGAELIDDYAIEDLSGRYDDDDEDDDDDDEDDDDDDEDDDDDDDGDYENLFRRRSGRAKPLTRTDLDDLEELF